MSEDVMKEEFNNIIPDLRKSISDEKVMLTKCFKFFSIKIYHLNFL